MAVFKMELPTDVLKDIEKIYQNSEKIFGEMTRAGAEVAEKNVKANLPQPLVQSDIMSTFYMTRPYKTPSDKGINTQIGFDGYFTNKEGRVTPAPLVANLFEYGRSGGYPKQPFFRKSFNDGAIETAMLAAQKKESGGILDE